MLVETAQETSNELVKEEYVEGMDEVLYLEVTDPKKKKTMYIKRPVQINNILFADPEMKEQIKGFCVLSDANAKAKKTVIRFSNTNTNVVRKSNKYLL